MKVREAFIEVTMGLHHTSPVIENEKPIIEIKEPEERAEIVEFSESIEDVQDIGLSRTRSPRTLSPSLRIMSLWKI